MRISVSVPGMAKKPFSSGSVGPAALSGREAAEDGSETESRDGRIAWPPPGTCAGPAWASVAGAVGAAAGSAVGAVGAGDGGGAAAPWVTAGVPASSASRRFSMEDKVCRSSRISCRNASAESCA
ncbi:hypothetical protein D3C72_1792330 [compost metagenome]